MSFIPGMRPVPFSISVSDLDATFLAEDGSSSNLTTYTFSSVSLGVAASDRYIVVGVGGRKSVSTVTVSTVTVAGVSATKLASRADSSDDQEVSIWIAAVPSGTTGDIVVTWNTSVDRCGIAAFRLTGLLSTAASDTGSSASGGTTSLTVSNVTIPDGGAGIYFACLANSVTASWTNATETSDATYENNFTSALVFPGDGSTPSVTCDWTAPAVAAMVGVSLR